MEKLLHDRLREPDTELCIGEMLELIVTGKIEDCTGRLCGQCIVDAMNSLADEIERTYVALPRDDKGVPVRGGDVFTDGVCEFSANYLVVDLNDQRRYWLFDDYGDDLTTEPFKRPTPKVYDADGVPCKPNDEVWSTSKEGVYEEGDMMIVVGIDAGVKERQVLVRRALGGAGEVWVNADALTHERPVFDAEGVRICKGDTVWDKKKGEQATVRCVTKDGMVMLHKDVFTYPEHPNNLTHREPDSLEKLRDDILNSANNEESTRGDLRARLYNAYDRLTALIERGA